MSHIFRRQSPPAIIQLYGKWH